ncbi:MAG: glycosyltransferase family 2 protein [Leptolyngbyaceae cyanobacterium]
MASQPQLSIIIPTHNRPQLLPIAVRSALAQTYQDLEVVVVDDASTEVAQLPDDRRLRVIRLTTGVGGAGARNVGTEAARGRWITYLDDDDYLLPEMAEISLAALAKQQGDGPVGVISGIRKVDEYGKVLSTRLPPDCCPQGRHFFLEPLPIGRSYHTKQTLVVEKNIVLKIGGWDETFRSRVHSEFFLRLNPVCKIVGLPTVTYHLLSHSGSRVSGNSDLRQASFTQLIQKHKGIFSAHPKMFAEFVYKHALKSYEVGQVRSAISHLFWALRLHPRHIAGLLKWSVGSQFNQTIQSSQLPSKTVPPSE